MIDIASAAATAAERGVPCTLRSIVSGVPVDVEISADGSVSVLTPGYEPVIENGHITEFRPVPVDPVAGIQMGAVAIHEMYLSLRRGGWGILAAAAYIAATVRYNGEDPQADQS